MHRSKRKDGYVAIKVDLQKAYDKVNWSFLLTMLHLFGFPDIFVNWIRLCVSTASYSIRINGQRYGFITPQCGIRQGCPLSPYLFVFVTEYLSLLLGRLKQQQLIS